MKTRTKMMVLSTAIALYVISIYLCPPLGVVTLVMLLLSLFIILVADFEFLGSRILRFLLPKLRKHTVDRGFTEEQRNRWGVAGVELFYVAFTFNRLLRRVISLSVEYAITSIRNKLKRVIFRISTVTSSNTSTSTNDNGWSSKDVVTQDVMQLILQRLWISDYVRCRAVCVSWRVAVDRAMASKCYTRPPAPQFPWLIRTAHLKLVNDNCFVSPSEDGKFYTRFPCLYRREIIGYIEEGWLIIVANCFKRPEGFINLCTAPVYTLVNYLLNPISGAQVMLPPQSTIPHPESNDADFMWKAVASSVPTTQSCVVASILRDLRILVFCRLNEKSWTVIERPEVTRGLIFRDLKFMDGKLFALTMSMDLGHNDFLLVFDIQCVEEEEDPTCAYTAQRLVMLPPMPIIRSDLLPIPQEQGGCGSMQRVTMIEPLLVKDPTSNELFVILRTTSCCWEEDPVINIEFLGTTIVVPSKVEGFQVFRLDNNNVVNNSPPQLVEIGDLGNRALTLSLSSKVLISCAAAAATTGFMSTTTTVQANSIYYAYHVSSMRAPSLGSDFGVFSLKNKLVRPLSCAKILPTSPVYCRTTWFTPTLW